MPTLLVLRQESIIFITWVAISIEDFIRWAWPTKETLEDWDLRLHYSLIVHQRDIAIAIIIFYFSMLYYTADSATLEHISKCIWGCPFKHF